MIYHFDQFELDIACFELREKGAAQSLEPQVFSLLAYLVEHHERLVSKNELFEKLWSGRVVTDSALTSRIKSARQALGDSGKAQQFIKTIHGKGFRFIADVSIAPAQRSSVTALPVMNTAVARSHDTFADGLTYELIAELTRLRWLLAIARGGMDSVRSPLERTACACRRCAARLNSAVATLLATGHVDLELVNPANHCPENERLGHFSSQSSI